MLAYEEVYQKGADLIEAASGNLKREQFPVILYA